MMIKVRLSSPASMSLNEPHGAREFLRSWFSTEEICDRAFHILVPHLLRLDGPTSPLCRSCKRGSRLNEILVSLVFFVLLLGTGASPLHGQDAVRPSLAGEESAEARRQSLDRIPYNLLAGPIRFRFSATLGMEYNDNINLAETGKQEDVIIRPQFNVNAIWPVTQLNTLRLDLGIGYAFYLDHPGYDTDGMLIAPGSALSFDLFVGDFRINFHDRFSLEQDPVAEIALSNVADYGRFQNTAGVSILWDLNQAVVTLGYDHYTYISTTSVFDYLDRNAEILSGSIGFTPTSTMTVGVEGSAVDTYYDQNILNDSRTYSVGGFLETQLTSYLKLRVAGGYQKIDFDSGGLVND